MIECVSKSASSGFETNEGRRVALIKYLQFNSNYAIRLLQESPIV
jgi:hypothetical protein